MNTRHKSDCKMAFGRKDASCPRCQELLSGAKPRGGYTSMRKESESRRLVEIKSHYGKDGSCKCGPVCTAFDW